MRHGREWDNLDGPTKKQLLEDIIDYGSTMAIETHPDFFANFLRNSGRFPPTALAWSGRNWEPKDRCPMCQSIYATYPVAKPGAPISQNTSRSYELAKDVDAPCGICAESLVVTRLYSIWKDTQSE